MEEKFLSRIIEPANPETPRGQNTWEWKFQEGHQISIYRRKKGEEFAEHYHKGKDRDKNPERFLLLKGIMRATFIGADKIPTTVTFDASVNPIKITIFPFVLHKMKALTECLYIEYRSHYFDPTNSDTFTSDEEQL